MKGGSSIHISCQILKHRIVANPEGVDILDGEIKCIEDKLDELDREIDGSANEWKELKSLVGVVREELEGKNVNYKEGDPAHTKEIVTEEVSTDSKGEERLSSKPASSNLELASGRTEERNSSVEYQAIRALMTAPNRDKGDWLAECDNEQSLCFDKSTIHGWGVFSQANISEGDMVIEYRGEIIDNSEAEKREQDYNKKRLGKYMFQIDETTVCDATKTLGYIGRYINASCSPNCHAQIISAGGYKRIVIYAKRDIQIGEELCFDYNFSSEDDESKRIPCNCGSANCRGSMN